MRSSLLRLPGVDDLDLVASVGTLVDREVDARDGRLSSAADEVPAAGKALVVVAGGPQASPGVVVDALVGAPREGYAEVATTSAWVVLRHGDVPAARAFVPGQRRPRPIEPIALGRADGAGSASGAGRPPRRIEVVAPAEVLAEVTLASAPALHGRDPAGAELVLDAVERAAGLLFVAGPTPFDQAQLELLRAAAERVCRVAFVLAGVPAEERAEVVAAQRDLLSTAPPAMAAAPWFTADPDGDPESGLGGLGDLRRKLAEWGAAVRPDPDGDPDTPVPAGGCRETSPVPADDERWRVTLDTEIRTRRAAAHRRLAGDLAASQGRCIHGLGQGQDCGVLPQALDRELQAISARTSRHLHADAAAVIRAVCTALLDREPDDTVLARVVAEVRRTIESFDDERPRPRALLLTTTSGVATLVGRGALDGLVTLGLPEPSGSPLAPIGVALTASCFHIWQRRGEDAEQCRAWLRQAVRVIEDDLRRELDQRFDDLQQALGLIASEAVDHGVLLA